MDDRLPTPILRAFPYAAGTALLVALLLALLAPRALLAQRNDGRIPPGHLPPAGLCRVWYDRLPPGRQPAPTDCATARAEAWRTGGRVIAGGRDDRRDGRRRDDGWWGYETGRIDPWGDRDRRRDGDWRDDDDRRERRERRRERDDVRWDDRRGDEGDWRRRRDDGDWTRRRTDAGTWVERREEGRRRKEQATRGDATGPWKRDRTDGTPRF